MIIFPAVSQNESPVSILGNFVEVLGRKIDSCEDQLDMGSQNLSHIRFIVFIPSSNL